MTTQSGNRRKKSRFCPSFNSVLFVTVGITVLSIGVALLLSFSAPNSPHQEALQKALFETCSTAWKMGRDKLEESWFVTELCYEKERILKWAYSKQRRVHILNAMLDNDRGKVRFTMETVGYILGAFSLLISMVGVIIGIFRNVDDLLIKAESAIKDEAERVYGWFGGIAVGIAGGKSGQIKDCAKRIGCLQYSLVQDVIKVKIIKWILSLGIKLVIAVVIIVGVSIGVGRLVLDKGQANVRFVLMVLVPFILLICQVVFLWCVIEGESYLKRVVERYKRSEY